MLLRLVHLRVLVVALGERLTHLLWVNLLFVLMELIGVRSLMVYNWYLLGSGIKVGGGRGLERPGKFPKAIVHQRDVLAGLHGWNSASHHWVGLLSLLVETQLGWLLALRCEAQDIAVGGFLPLALKAQRLVSLEAEGRSVLLVDAVYLQLKRCLMLLGLMLRDVSRKFGGLNGGERDVVKDLQGLEVIVGSCLDDRDVSIVVIVRGLLLLSFIVLGSISTRQLLLLETVFTRPGCLTIRGRHEALEFGELLVRLPVVLRDMLLLMVRVSFHRLMHKLRLLTGGHLLLVKLCLHLWLVGLLLTRLMLLLVKVQLGQLLFLELLRCWLLMVLVLLLMSWDLLLLLVGHVGVHLVRMVLVVRVLLEMMLGSSLCLILLRRLLHVVCLLQRKVLAVLLAGLDRITLQLLRLLIRFLELSE